MIVLACLALVVVSVPLTGGDLRQVTTLGIRHTWVIALALGVQTLVISVAPRSLSSIAAEVHLASYALAAVFFWLNRRVAGLWIVGLGGAANLVAIIANGGVMPASAWATRTAGVVQASGEFANSAQVDDPKLLVFGDIFAVPSGWPLANVFSIGDALLIVGAAVVLHSACRRRVATPSTSPLSIDDALAPTTSIAPLPG